MYRLIINDFLKGISDSIKLNYLTRAVKKDQNIRNIIKSIIRFNAAVYFLPHIILGSIGFLINVNLTFTLCYLMYPLGLVSMLVHTNLYTKLLHGLTVVAKIENKSFLDLVSFTLTMMIYHLAIYLTTFFAYIIFNPKLHFIIDLLVVFVLVIYHSYDCFNILWYCKKINLGEMVNLCEQSWPYYMGYGMIATMLYLFKFHPVINGLYNLYMALILSIPFLCKDTYPKKKPSYPKINLSIFSKVTGYLTNMAKITATNIYNSTTNIDNSTTNPNNDLSSKKFNESDNH